MVAVNDPNNFVCTLVDIDFTDFFYTACSVCEKTLSPTFYFQCQRCNSTSKRLFRLHISIGTCTKIFTIVMFDRAARVLLGCSAGDLFEFFNLHSSAAKEAVKILEGEMMKITLSKPKNEQAQHLRAVSVVPLCTGFRPLIASLKDIYAPKPDQKLPTENREEYNILKDPEFLSVL